MSGGFNERARAALADAPLQEALQAATGRFADLRVRAFQSTAAPLALRAKAREIRRRTFEEIDRHLETLFKSLERLGVRVHPAADAAAARRVVLEIARKNGVKTVVKSKSMATEEIHLNQALEAAGITPCETDLGEWILQLANETPSHLVAPAIHKTLGQVQDVFREKVDSDPGPDPEALTAIAREKLRAEFLRAGMGISGVNFAVAETGTLCLVTNEGNGRLVTTLPKTHVAVMGFEKVVPTLRETLTLLSVLPRSATGQKLSSYFTMLTGPRREGEADGPDEAHLVLLDGGRSRHLGTPFQEAFHCIRCGACQNACPVFQTVGGHAYDSVYGGPIGSILSPMLRGLDASGELPAASSLCGACMDACPVFVDIPRMLLEMREARTAKKSNSTLERLAFRLIGAAMRRPLLWETGGRAAAMVSNLLGEKAAARLPGPARAWTRGRDLPRMAKKSFRARWRERNRGAADAQPSVPEPRRAEAPDAVVEKAHHALELGRGLSHGSAGAPPDPLPEIDVPDPAARFALEFEAVANPVRRPASMEEARECVLEIAAGWRERPVAVSARLPVDAAAWLSEAGFELRFPSEEGDDRAAIAGCGLGITGCDWAIAETGSVVLRSGPGRPRLHSLLPEAHLALIPERSILPHISSLAPELEAALAGERAAAPSCVSVITGPSRSADIALTLIKGVHGPREVFAVLLPDRLAEGDG